MALPFRSGAALVKLYTPPSGASKGIGVIDNFITAGGVAPRQPDFYSYQWWYKDYPDEVIVKTHQAGGGEVVIGISRGTIQTENVYPDNIVIDYDPNPPYSDPVPNPNGTVGTYNGTPTETGLVFSKPRWHAETAYDFSATYIPTPYSLVPEPGLTGYIGYTENINGLFSIDVTATNLDSEVFNRSTSAFEYYPFTQATQTFKKTTKFKVNIVDTAICCWNDGTIIRGKVAYKSVTATATTRSAPGTTPPGYGWGGMDVVVGSTYTAAGEATWEVTIEDGFVPTEIEIPKVSGSFTFINDFWVTEVVKPT